MFKRVLALTMAAILLLMPMTAGAVSWGQVAQELRNSGSYSADGLSATLKKGQTENDDVYTITGGKLFMEDYSYAPGTYNFSGVTFEGYEFWLNAYNGAKLVFNVDKDCVDEMEGGVTAFVGKDSEIIVNTDMDIVYDDGYVVNVISWGDGKFTLSGDGKIITVPYTDEDGVEWEYLPIVFKIRQKSDDGMLSQNEINELLDYAKNNFKYDQDMLSENKYATIASLEILVTNEEGEEIGFLMYDVDENGNIISWNFEDIEEEQEEMDPSIKAYLEEQERIARKNHERELKRHAEAIGGVTASPEWVKQLYLGYMSLNLRMYENGEHILFREKLAWVGDGTKNLTLRVNIEEPQALSIRLDEMVLNKLEQAEISLVTLLNKSSETVMQYSVSDLRGAYEKYGLSGADLLVVGGMDDEVMKIGADGVMVPVETEAEEATPAEATPAEATPAEAAAE